jgi:hypothetical protein
VIIENGIASNGNISIGTNNPQTLLDIRGTSPTIKLLDTRADGDAIIQFRETSDLYGMDIAYIGNLDNKMYFKTYNNSATATNVLTIDRANGNVGVGTTDTNTYKLNINGTSLLNGQVYIGEASGGSTIFMGGGAAGDNGYNHSVIETRNYAGTEKTEMLLFKGNDPVGNVAVSDRIRLRAGAIVFDTYPSGTTFRNDENIRMVINSEGNVGIGTSNPTTKLHICDSAINETKLTIQNINLPTELVVSGTTRGTIGTTERFITFPYSVSAYTFTTTELLTCDILVVAGGGGGGSRHAGGGGAGAVIYLSNQTFSIGTYSVSVGNGGNGKISTNGQGDKGGDSSIMLSSTTLYLAKGGGAGHHAISTGNSNRDGGSGGGGGDVVGIAVTTNIPTGAYGNSGGIFSSGGEASYGGGGGGSGGAGANAVLNASSLSIAGNGGIGRELSINGTATYYGGGGGGVALGGVSAGSGGLGGGGAGSKGAVTATSGSSGTGGGVEVVVGLMEVRMAMVVMVVQVLLLLDIKRYLHHL